MPPESTIAFKDPPARTNAVFNDHVLDQLRARPNQWALIRTYSRTSRVRADFDYRPGDIEIKLRYYNVHKPGGRTELYARYVPGGLFD